MANIREVAQGEQQQGADETIIWAIDITNWGSSPTSITAKVFDIEDGKLDVTGTVMPTNSPSPSGNVITLSPLTALTQGRIYQLEVQFTANSNVLEAFAIIHAK